MRPECSSSLRALAIRSASSALNGGNAALHRETTAFAGPDFARAKSVPATAVFSRCKAAFPPFNADEADRIARARNEELHSGLMPFDAVPNQAIWWERYWAQAIILIEAQDEDVDSFVGSRRSSTVQEHLDSNVDHVNEYTTRRIAAGLQRW